VGLTGREGGDEVVERERGGALMRRYQHRRGFGDC